MAARKTWMTLACYLLTASTAFAEGHWAHGCWQTDIWGGIMIRPDGYVTESDPDGNLRDIGRWWPLGDEHIWWFLACEPNGTHFLRKDGLYTHEMTPGYDAPPQDLRRSFVPDEYDDLWIGLEPPEPILDFPEDWK